METTKITLFDDNTLSITYVLDHFRKIIHLLDLPEGSVDLPSGIEHVQDYFMNRKECNINSEWSWFLYKRNGSLNIYTQGNFFYVPLSDVRVYPAFIGEMLVRTNKQMYAVL